MLENTEGEELYKIQGAEIHCGDKIDCGEHNIKQNDDTNTHKKIK